MLYTKFQGNRTISSGEKKHEEFYDIGHGGHHGHVTQFILYQFP